MPDARIVTFTFNDAEIASFRAEASEFTRVFDLESRSDRPNELVVTTSAAVVPAELRTSDDTRPLGLLLRSLSWRPLR